MQEERKTKIKRKTKGREIRTERRQIRVKVIIAKGIMRRRIYKTKLWSKIIPRRYEQERESKTIKLALDS